MQKQSNRPVDSFEGIVLRYEDRLLRAAVAVVGSRADAEDIVQEVFVRLFQKCPAFDSDKHETAWLLRVTVNLSKNHLRSLWRKTVPLLESVPAKSDDQQETMQAVLALPPKYRAVIHLYYYEGYSTKEIAEITEQKEPAVRRRLTRARQKLKHFLKGEFT